MDVKRRKNEAKQRKMNKLNIYIVISRMTMIVFTDRQLICLFIIENSPPHCDAHRVNYINIYPTAIKSIYPTLTVNTCFAPQRRHDHIPHSEHGI